MRVLVTGATGFLGGVVARELLEAGHAVMATGRQAERGERLRAWGLDFRPADLRGADWAWVLRGADAVVHCAARSSLWGRWSDFVSDNVNVSAALAGECARRGLRLIHISTPSVYNAAGRTSRVPESTPIGPHFDSLYARSKWLAEEAVRAALPDATLLRPRGIYGAGDTGIVPRLVRSLRSERLPRLTRGEVYTELTHVRNVSHAVRLALSGPAPGVFNVTDGETIPLWATLDRLADALEVSRPARFIPAPVVEALAAGMEGVARLLPGQPEPVFTASGIRLLTRSMTLDLTRARARLGYVPVVRPASGLDEVLAQAARGAFG
ncbi:NAD-dependent epimerase/dehydratase family protein [Deinococcus hopiensis]|uniref:NAD-dependent epimerase/dehydratase family protein n=1 Tax=Deinococcus hopiensis TaxID=309885 RepID=UPI000A004783|nr:NAD-dependent epimerase/dehydratase family protein [Deinococcus hopiensis]